MKAIRNIIIGILDKLEISHTEKITTDRATKKLRRHLDKEGWPEGIALTSKDRDGLDTVGLLDEDTPEAAEPDASSKPAKKPAKKSNSLYKGDTDTTAPAAEPAAKKDKKPAQPKPQRANWMEECAKAILASEGKTVKEAAAKAVVMYGTAGGAITEKSDEWGVLYSNYAIKVLVTAGVVGLDDEGLIVVL